MTGSPSIWTPATDQVLKDGRLIGQSFTQIAKTVSRTAGVPVSRNAAIGRAKRIGLTLPAEQRHALLGLANVSNRVSERRQAPAEKTANNGVFRKPPTPLPDTTTSAGRVESPDARPWTERKFGQCAWPIDPAEPGAEIRSCCNPCDLRGYCPGHAAIMWVKPKGIVRGVRAPANQTMEAA